jgi:small subunit ribosomal protein S8
MSMTDPIADLLTRIRNASQIRAEKVEIPASNLKESICRILKEEGYLKNYRKVVVKKKATLRVFLKYDKDQQPVVRGIRRVSKPSVRRYANAGSMPRVLGGLGVCVVSTSRGVMTGTEAKNTGVGGEILCEVW